MICRHFVLLSFVLTVFLSCAGVANAQRKKEKGSIFEKLPKHPGTKISRDQIIKNREKRTDQLDRLLGETKDKVADHHAGTNLLEDEELAKFTKRAELYHRKLEKMKQPLDEKEIARMVQREETRAARRHREL